MDALHLIQAPGSTVPQLDGKPWPEEGLTVVPDQYIRRRMADGDLIEAPPAPKAKKSKPTAEPPPEPAAPAIEPGDAPLAKMKD